MTEQVVLVDENNNELGVMEKLEAHEKGLLHRAFSILIFNSRNELLVTQRAENKHTCAGLWSNTVCSHPRPKEDYLSACKRRLEMEMGFECELEKLFCFTYKVEFDNGLTENEFDCVFTGRFDGKVKPNPKEVMAFKWVSVKELEKDVKKNPDKYTEWFKIILGKLKEEQSLL
ncbi:MAG: isopentenyl-diphosphate Delta-isomerase [archaeon]